MAAAMAFCSCEKEKIYTELELDQMGIIVEWVRSGWDEVYNELDAPVTLVTCYPDGMRESVTSTIAPGEFVELNRGQAAPGYSLEECKSAQICFGNEEPFTCFKDGNDACSKRFFEHVEQRQAEVVELSGNGMKVRRNLLVRTYHIDRELIELSRDAAARP